MIINHGALSAHLAIRLDAVLEAVQLPAGIAHLNSSLTHVYIDNLTLKRKS